MPLAVITSKGQTTIPKQIRDLLRLEPGDKIDFIVRDGQVLLAPATSDVSELEGILHRPGRKPVSVQEIEQSVRRRFRKRPA